MSKTRQFAAHLSYDVGLSLAASILRAAGYTIDARTLRDALVREQVERSHCLFGGRPITP